MVDEGTKGFAKWTGELVLHCLEEPFRRKPDAAMFSMATVSDLPSDGPIEGTHLIQATALALGFDSRARIHILYHARSRATGELIKKLSENRSWKLQAHYWWVRRGSIAVAKWLNARVMQVPPLQTALTRPLSDEDQGGRHLALRH